MIEEQAVHGFALTQAACAKGLVGVAQGHEVTSCVARDRRQFAFPNQFEHESIELSTLEFFLGKQLKAAAVHRAARAAVLITQLDPDATAGEPLNLPYVITRAVILGIEKPRHAVPAVS